MPGMTIENIGNLVKTGDLEQVVEHGQTVQAPTPPGTDAAGEKSFGEVLKASIDNVNETQLQADRAIKELAAGRNKNIHETMLMMEKADMSFRLMMQARNKVIEAYREIMRMQV